MLSYLWRCYSAVQGVFRYFGSLSSYAFGILSRIFLPLIGDYPSKRERPDDLEANGLIDTVSKTPDHNIYTIRLKPQSDLEVLGVGASSEVYKVAGGIVLKASWIFEPPGDSASKSDRWHYASDTIFHSNLLQDERTILRLFQQRPHPHIIQAVDTDHPEGIYLREYQPLSGDKIPTQTGRIQWYRNLTSALNHIHSLGIAHADIRIENILLNEQSYPILCDFSAASPFGQPNLVFPDLPLPINGPFPILSETTDMFAMASLIFQMEHGGKPEQSIDSHRTLILPKIRTGHQGIDTIIRQAWLGQYSCTSEMLEHLASISDNIGRDKAHTVEIHSEPTEILRDRVRKWRDCREKKFGYILDGILSEGQLQVLADRHGLERNADSRFLNYLAPL